MTTDSAVSETSAAVAPDVRPTGDPAILGLPSFVVGSIALGLALVGYVPAAAVGAALPIIFAATGLGLLVAAVWSAALGQSFVAAVFGIFAGFWLSYTALVLGLLHNWYKILAADVTHTQALFLISWAILIFLLTVASVRLPLAYTVLLVLIVAALVLLVIATVNASTGLTKVAGVVVFAFAAIGAYLFLSSSSVALGGSAYPVGRPLQS